MWLLSVILWAGIAGLQAQDFLTRVDETLVRREIAAGRMPDVYRYVKRATVYRFDSQAYVRLMDARPARYEWRWDLPDGGQMRVTGAERNITAPGFRTFLDGRPVTYRPGLHYADGRAAFSFTHTGVGGVFPTPRGDYVLGKLGDSGYYVFYNDADLLKPPGFRCSTPDFPVFDPPPVQERTADDCYAAAIVYDLDRFMYQDYGGEQGAIDYLHLVHNVLHSVFLNENLHLLISDVFVWSEPGPWPEGEAGAGDILDAYVNYRGVNFNGTLAHFLTTRLNGLGGLAYLDVLCAQREGSSIGCAFSNIGRDYQEFPLTSWTVEVVAHELGHNYGSPHTQWCGWEGGAIDGCVEPEGDCLRPPMPPIGSGSIMSYCHLTEVGVYLVNGFDVQPGNLIRRRAREAYLGGCMAEGYVSVAVENEYGDMNYCPGSGPGVELRARGAHAYVWSPADGLSSAVGDHVFAAPTQTTIYTVVGTDASGCAGVGYVRIQVGPEWNLDDISLPDTIRLCAGGEYEFLYPSQWYSPDCADGGTASPLIYVDWQPRPFFRRCNRAVFRPEQSTLYTASISLHSCTVRKTIFLQTYSETMDVEITGCLPVAPGESVTLTAQPGTEYRWMPGELSGRSVVVSPTQTTVYTLTARNQNGCLIHKETLVPGGKEAMIDVTVTGNACGAGAVMVPQFPGTAWEWRPFDGLDDPFAEIGWAKPETTTTYTLTLTGADGCKRYGTATVEACPTARAPRPSPDSFEIYPNPHSGSFVVQWTGALPAAGPLVIYDARGRSIYRTHAAFNHPHSSLPLTLDLAPGVYRLFFAGTGRTFLVR
jgi:hypothetical protein